MMLARHRTGDPTPINEVVMESISGGPNNEGRLEHMEAVTDNAAFYIGNLTAMLHTAGVLSDEQILELVGYPREKAE